MLVGEAADDAAGVDLDGAVVVMVESYRWHGVGMAKSLSVSQYGLSLSATLCTTTEKPGGCDVRFCRLLECNDGNRLTVTPLTTTETTPEESILTARHNNNISTVICTFQQ